MLSPLQIPPLEGLGRWAARKVHGNRRSSQGYLLTASAYIDEDQEWQLGQAYLGLLALPLDLLCFAWVMWAHPHLGYVRGNRRVIGHWADLLPDLRIVIPLLVIAHVVFLASAFRAVLIWRGLGSREDLGE